MKSALSILLSFVCITNVVVVFVLVVVVDDDVIVCLIKKNWSF